MYHFKPTDIERFCGLFYQTLNYISSHNWKCYQPVLTINKIVQAERKRKQLQQKERTAYEISKSRGKKYKIINLTVSKTIGDYKLKRLQNKFSPFIVNPIKTEFTDVLGVSKPEQGKKHVDNMTQTNNETLGPMDGRNIHHGQSQTSSTCATASEINVARQRIKSLHSKKGVKADNKVARNTDTKLVSKESIENDEYNLNLEASALHEAVKFQMQNGRSPSLEDLEKFLSNEEISRFWVDLEYLYGKGWNKPTATIPSEGELVEVVI